MNVLVIMLAPKHLEEQIKTFEGDSCIRVPMLLGVPPQLLISFGSPLGL